MAERREIAWVNTLRALGMVGVYLWHCETYAKVYFAQALIVPVCMPLFFYVSGYLFGRKYDRDDALKGSAFRDAFSTVLFRLVIPTLFFTALALLPKVFLLHEPFTWRAAFLEIFGGGTFWFTSALVLIHLFALLLFRFVGRGTWLLLGLSVVLMAGYLMIEAPYNARPWSYTSAMRYFLFFSFGIISFRLERQGQETTGQRRWAWWLVAYIALSLVLMLLLQQDFTGTLLQRTLVLLFGLLPACCGICAWRGMAERLPAWRWMAFVGRKTIVFYFLCSAIPFGVARLLAPLGLDAVFAVPLALAVSLLLATATVWAIYRYIPFLVDIRKLKKS